MAAVYGRFFEMSVTYAQLWQDKRETIFENNRDTRARMKPGAMDRIREQILENRLIELAAAGDADGVKELISMGVNVNTQNAVNGWYLSIKL